MSLKNFLIGLGEENPNLRDDLRHIISSIDKRSSQRVGRRLFSRKAYRNLRRSLGKRTSPFFRFYRELRRIYKGAEDPPEDGFSRTFRDLAKILIRSIDGEDTKDVVKNLARDGERYFRRLDKLDDVTENNSRTKRIYSKLIKIFGNIIIKVGKDQNIYLKKEKLKRPGWLKFSLMNPKEKKMEKFKETNEELYEVAKEKDKVRERLNEKIEKEVQSHGLNPKKKHILGAPVISGEEVQASLQGRGKQRGDDVWKLNEELSKKLNPEELDGEAVEIELELDGDKYKVIDYYKEDGEWYLKTAQDIDTKQWGNCTLRQKESWIYPDDGGVYTEEEYREKRERDLEARDKLSRVFPDDHELGAMKKYGTEIAGKGRRGDLKEHGQGKFRWVLADKDVSFNPEKVLDHPESQMYLHLDEQDYAIVDWGIFYDENLERDFVYVESPREIDEKTYGQYAIQEKNNILERYKEDQDLEYRALSDDMEKQTSMTRIYPTVEIHGETVIAEGRYKGMLLEDMINEAGRMIEGVAYDYDPEVGRPVQLDSVPDQELREPYITVTDDGELRLKLPSRNNYTELRNKVRDLAHGIPEMDYEEGTRQTAYTFDPEQFRSVRDTVKSVAMSDAAREKIEGYFDEMAKDQSQFSDENLSNYSSDVMTGFKDFFDFREKQKEALAWLDGESGLVGADTGTGKTLIAVGYVKDLMRKGELSEGDKVLFVCPSSLEGNFESEAQSFLENPDELLQYVETKTYGELSRLDVDRDVSNKGDPEKDVIVGDDKDFIKDYAAVIFDEASYLKSRTSDRSLLAQAEHPKKVLLSASPMEKDPIELYHLAAVANNWDIQDYEGLKKRRKFQKRFSEKIGSRPVSITQDPTEREELVDWMSSNMFQIDKTEMKDVDLPSLEREAVGVSMPEEMEEEYRKLTSRVEETMRGMVKVFRDKDKDAYAPEVTGAVSQLKGLFSRLEGLQNRPDEYLDGVDENPKLRQSLEVIKNDIGSKSRALLWTDSSEFAKRSAKYLSESLPGIKHAYGTSDEIGICKNGRVVDTYSKRVYEDPETGERVDPGQWRQFVVDQHIKPSYKDVVSFTLTQSYSKGFNLQEFDKVLHLDRNDWNAEEMKQRTARSWRQGQDETVEEYTMDMTFSEPADEFDRTLDEIRKYVQNMEEDLFQQFIKETQKEKPGKAWFGMKKEPAELYDAQRDVVEMMASPYIENQAKLKEELKREQHKS